MILLTIDYSEHPWRTHFLPNKPEHLLISLVNSMCWLGMHHLAQSVFLPCVGRAKALASPGPGFDFWSCVFLIVLPRMHYVPWASVTSSIKQDWWSPLICKVIGKSKDNGYKYWVLVPSCRYYQYMVILGVEASSWAKWIGHKHSEVTWPNGSELP